VLMSISSDASYRANKRSDGAGNIVFPGLFPGRYFLRPLLKEYKFEPKSASIEIGESGAVAHSFSATRVAYSVFGSVTSLNGDPEANVMLEAIGTRDGDGEGAGRGGGSAERAKKSSSDRKKPTPKRYEETRSDANGRYRLRGLYPGYTYSVQMKQSEQLEKALPPRHVLRMQERDEQGVDFNVLRAPQRLDITGVLNVTDSARAILKEAGASGSPELEIQVIKEAGQQVEVIESTKLSQHIGFFEFIGLPRGEYIVRCISTALGKKKATFEVYAPEVHLDLSESHEHIEMSFHAEYKMEDDMASAAGSVISLLAGLMIFGSIVFHSEVKRGYKKFVAMFSSKEKLVGEKARGGSSGQSRGANFETKRRSNLKSRKKNKHRRS